jgi:afadin
MSMPGIFYEREDDDQATQGIMKVLTFAMGLLRKCRVNAALTIQLFSQLFHYINMWTFNEIVNPEAKNYCTHRWGMKIKKRMGKVEQWAEKQGLELAADCHLARVVQAAHLLQARKNTAEDIASVSSICFKLNSVQLRTLLDLYEPSPDERPISREMIDTIVRVAENTVDEVTLQENREVRLEEDLILQLPFLLPEDGYSCDIVKGVPSGLTEFIAPLQRAGLCVMTPQPTSLGKLFLQFLIRIPKCTRWLINIHIELVSERYE